MIALVFAWAAQVHEAFSRAQWSDAQPFGNERAMHRAVIHEDLARLCWTCAGGEPRYRPAREPEVVEVRS